MSAELLRTIAGLKFTITTRDASGTVELGLLVAPKGIRPPQQKLMIQSSNWTLGVAPPDVPSFLITRDTYEVLREATAADDGSFMSKGKRYRLRANDSAVPPVADLVPA
jgi:hypothetical protein